MTSKERSAKLAQGLLLLLVSQLCYALIILVYDGAFYLLAMVVSMICGVLGLLLLWPLAADYKRAMVTYCLVQFGLSVLCVLFNRHAVVYLVLLVASYVGTWIQAWLICSATGTEMERLGAVKLQKWADLVKKIYFLELAGRVINLSSMFLGDAMQRTFGIVLGGVVVAGLLIANMLYAWLLFRSWQAARQFGAEPRHL